MDQKQRFLRQAIELAEANVARGARPYGAVLVKDGQVIATGVNDVINSHDPTRHAELDAIRAASQILKTPQLDGCEIYASGQPCPMCLSAMYLTGIRTAYFAYSNADGEPYGLTTAPIYEALRLPLDQQPMTITQVRPDDEPPALYQRWRQVLEGSSVRPPVQ